MRAFFHPDFVRGGHKCTGERRAVNAQRGIARAASPLPSFNMCARRNISKVAALFKSPHRLIWPCLRLLTRYLLLLTRVGLQVVALGCFHRVLPHQNPRRQLRQLQQLMLMGQDKSLFHPPSCKPCEKNPRIRMGLQIQTSATASLPLQPMGK